MTGDIDMGDIALEEELSDCVTTLKNLIDQLNVISVAVPSLDLRSLSRMKMAGIKRTLTEPLLKRCLQTFVGKGVLKDTLLATIGGGSEVAKLDERLEKLLEAPTRSYDCPEVAFFFAILVTDFMMKRQTNASEVQIFSTDFSPLQIFSTDFSTPKFMMKVFFW